MVVSMNRGPKYRTPEILCDGPYKRGPPKKKHPNFGKPQYRGVKPRYATLASCKQIRTWLGFKGLGLQGLWAWGLYGIV